MRKPSVRTVVYSIVLAVGLGGAIWGLANWYRSNDIPVPFLDRSATTSLKGEVIPIGRKNSIVVERVRFLPGETTETIHSGKIYLVHIPDDSLVPQVALDQAVRAIGQGNPVVNYFGYKYTTADATDEKAHRDDADFLIRFPGKFFASQTALDQDAANGGTLAAFHARTGAMFLETGTSSGVHLEQHSLYMIVENEPIREVAFTIRPLPVCGDSVQELPLEQCDDGNLNPGDGCDNYCQIEYGWYCQEETPGGQTNATPATPAFSNRLAGAVNTAFDRQIPKAEASGICGDGTLDTAEDCDDGNLIDGDGCSAICRKEADMAVAITGPQVWDGNITSLDLVPRHWQYSVTLQNNGPETLKFVEVKSGPLPVPSLLNAASDASECERDQVTGELVIPLRCWFTGPFPSGWSRTFTVTLDTQLDVSNPQPPAIDFTMEIGNYGGVGAEPWIVTQLSDPVLFNNAASAFCGNGSLNSGEQCDAGTLNTPSLSPVTPPRPWCLDNCTLNLTSCGDNKVDAWEYCDDGDLTNGDGCSNSCQVESGWTCTGDPSVCTSENPPGSGMTWTAIIDTELQTASPTSIAYGDGKFVGVGGDNKGAYSFDGITWTLIGDIKFGVSGIYNTSITYGNGKFVAVNRYGRGAYSLDGITWTSIADMTFVENRDYISSVTYGDGKFVAVGVNTGDANHYHGKAAYSLDGITWTAVEDMGIDETEAHSVTYGNGKFVAVDNLGAGAYSLDGITWNTIDDMKVGGGSFNSVAYGDGKFVAVGSNGNGAYSSDGITWIGTTVGGIVSDGRYFNSVAYGDGKFVAVGWLGHGAYSSDGITWQMIDDMKFDDHPIYAVIYGTDKFVAVGWGGHGAYSGETNPISSSANNSSANSSTDNSSANSSVSSVASSQNNNHGRSVCHTLCGDGLTANTEQCDDGNQVPGDGCSDTCTVESGWTCTGTNPSGCMRLCGNGVLDPDEECDDANLTDGDSCSSLCKRTFISPAVYLDERSVGTGTINVSPGQTDVPLLRFTLNAKQQSRPQWFGIQSTTQTLPLSDASIWRDSNGDGVVDQKMAGDFVKSPNWNYGTVALDNDAQYDFPKDTPVLYEIHGDILSSASGSFTVRLVSDGSISLPINIIWKSATDDSYYALLGGVTFDGGSCIAVDPAYSSPPFYRDCDIIATTVMSPTWNVTTCGDGIKAETEACDDHNTTPGDGCSATCTVESVDGWACDNSVSPSVCHKCGNGIVESAYGEACDDGNMVDGDGCSSTCIIDEVCTDNDGDNILTKGTVIETVAGVPMPGRQAEDYCPGELTVMEFICTSPYYSNGQLRLGIGVPHICPAGYHCNDGACILTCGNGQIESAYGETCDDGDTDPGDGCSATCQTEANYTCTGEPSVCVPPSSADLAVTSFTGPDNILAGLEYADYTIGTSNNGPNEANDATLVINFSGFTFDPLHSDPACHTTPAQDVSCSFPENPVPVSYTKDFVVRLLPTSPLMAGDHVESASVYATTPIDLDNSNNSKELTVHIGHSF